MKFACNKETILNEIIYSMDFTSQRNSLSITSNVYLETFDDKLIIRATDQKIGFSTEIAVQTIENGSITVYCDRFLNILRSLPNSEIQFSTKDGMLAIKPTNQTIDFKLRTISGDEFPQMETIGETPFFSVSQRDFNEMATQTIFSISEDETRFFLCGLYLERSSTGMNMVATDGRRLSIVERKFSEEIPSFPPVIIPSKFFIELKKLSSDEGLLDLCITENLIYAKIGNRFFYSNLIKGQYPNYRRVIPETQKYAATMRIQDMLDALKRVSLLIENKAKRIFLDISEAGVLVTSDESELGEAKEIIPCKYEGPESKVSLNFVYLLNPLKVMEGEYFSINFTEPTRAMTVKPEAERDYFHIIMPMQPNA
ncbi:DNA polymerase III, beta subunit [Sphaerochaeta pleomorpha str. Grapes]|uniref:Beta sliding clamp n=1 Tax=Sphaerochaeta pleomorpha (strain ATCC BAA-1885 / DSM 22778 / Grapes) TaxID=158190 RepID=G8QYT7_SPHPG|nr:DNA polymerase III subunit beta [Sphaerochaeta pleomorpha]AEV29714.1 DNA polymerase III, beta subunit [Sphaerochaeta pleomorpha str. Grapes]